MRHQPYLLSEPARRLVLTSILEVCAIRGWKLLAAHIRSNHAHAVLEAAIPEKVLLDFKVNSSRALNRLEGKRVRWARHGSTRHLWTKTEIDRAVGYVVSKQGAPMSLYEAPPRVPA
jgi:REP element-mobilizing transposase RayT